MNDVLDVYTIFLDIYIEHYSKGSFYGVLVENQAPKVANNNKRTGSLTVAFFALPFRRHHHEHWT